MRRSVFIGIIKDSGLDASAAAPAEPDKKRNKSKSSRRRKRKERKRGRAARGSSKNSDEEAAATFFERSLMTDGMGTSMAALARPPRKVVKKKQSTSDELLLREDSLITSSTTPVPVVKDHREDTTNNANQNVPDPGGANDSARDGEAQPEDAPHQHFSFISEKTDNESSNLNSQSSGAPSTQHEHQNRSSANAQRNGVAFTQEQERDVLRSVAQTNHVPMLVEQGLLPGAAVSQSSGSIFTQAAASTFIWGVNPIVPVDGNNNKFCGWFVNLETTGFGFQLENLAPEQHQRCASYQAEAFMSDSVYS